jgi:AcrR family transcriptional regulator
MPSKAKPSRAYHHGALRDALLARGMHLVEQENAPSLGVRELARDVGVTPMAVYRHFPDKADLMAAVAKEGLDKLAQEQAHAFDEAGGGFEGFIASGRAYVRFAIRHPMLFRLILSHAPKVDLLHAPPKQTPAAIRYLRENARALAPKGADAAQVKLLALQAWAQVHGLAMLMLDGQVPADDALIDAVINGQGLRS